MKVKGHGLAGLWQGRSVIAFESSSLSSPAVRSLVDSVVLRRLNVLRNGFEGSGLTCGPGGCRLR